MVIATVVVRGLWFVVRGHKEGALDAGASVSRLIRMEEHACRLGPPLSRLDVGYVGTLPGARLSQGARHTDSLTVHRHTT